MHIGYLIQQFPPEVGAGSARAVEMARHWLTAGARVTIFTGMPNRPEGRIHEAYRGRIFMEETWEGMRVLRSWLYASPKHGVLRTLTNNATFMMTSAVRGMAGAGSLDVLIASSPPLFPHLSGQFIGAAHRLPLVLEVRDLWPDYLVDMGMLQEGSIGARALFALERGLLRRANAVTVVTESFRQRVIQKGVHSECVHVMPAGVDAHSYFRSDEPAPIDVLQRRHPDEFIVGYLGNFGAGQALGTILDAAALLAERAPRIRLVLVGDGPEREQLEKAAKATRGNLTIRAPIQKSATRAFYANCDICLVPLAAIPVFQETIPSKIFEILACERPIVASVDGEARRVTHASGGGWVTPPGDAAALADAICRAAHTSSEERARMGARGRAFVLENFARSVIAKRYLEVLERVASAPRRMAGRSGRGRHGLAG